MSKKGHLYWDHQINPIHGGCTRVSPGCDNCYAATLSRRFKKTFGETDYNNPEPKFTLDLSCFDKIPKAAKWIFVQNMGDLFHEQCPEAWQKLVLDRIKSMPQHQFLVLTKRPHNVIHSNAHNLWTGFTAENQECFNERIEYTSQLPGIGLWLSLEPLLEPIEINHCDLDLYDWVVVGAETGPKRRPCNIEWIRSVVQQCDEARIPVWVKQIQDENGKVIHDINQFPEDVRRRERQE